MKPGQMAKWKLAGAGIVFAGIGLLGALDSMAKASWREAEAKVAAISVSCHMKAEEQHIGYKTVNEADIDCGAVDAFKALHADLNWTSTENIDGTLSVPGLNGDVVSASMQLHRTEGRLPQVGDKLVVAQDPKNPAKVARTDAAQTSALIFVIMGGIGAVILWFAFGVKGKTPKGAAGLGLDGDAGAAESAKKADALIAAALANNKSQAAPAPKPMTAGKPMAARPQPAMVTPGAARSSFGRKR
jgi:hypothetical protein